MEKSELSARVMLSPEPFTMPKSGYPLLLQTGEEIDGQPLHDRQHPHDLFMEIAMTYRRALSDSSAAELYLAASGEPALGPTAFPHRASAESDPLAALGHHWEDSTHIAFGVATVGVVLFRDLKAEVSVFNGREPDETRTNFDFRKLDCLRARVVCVLGGVDGTSLVRLSREPRGARSGRGREAVHGLRISCVAFRDVGPFRFDLRGRPERSVPGRCDARAPRRNEPRSRWKKRRVRPSEFVQKSGQELSLDVSRADRTFDVGSFVVGYLREFQAGPLRLGAGMRFAVNSVSRDLSSFYGTSFPAGGMVYLRVRPPAL